MKLLETYKPAYGAWVSIEHPIQKDRELSYWAECKYQLPTLGVYTKDFNNPYQLTRIRKEDYETT